MILSTLKIKNQKQRNILLAVLALFVITLLPSIWMVATTLPQIKVDYDVTAYKAYQTERTLYAFYGVVEDAINTPEQVQTDDLVASYDHAVAAAQLLDDSPRGDLHNEIHEYNQSIKLLVGVLSQYRPQFESGLGLAQNTEKLKEIRFAVYRILPQIKNMVWAANQASERFIAKRNKMLLEQSLMVIGLVCTLILGLLGFMFVLYQQLKKEQEQNEALRILSEAVRVAKTEAENANAAKATMVGVISHELRTPFQGLMGMLELLGEANLTSSDRKALDSAQGAASHLLQLLNDLVDLSVLETRTLKLSQDIVHLPQFLGESVATLEVAASKSDVALDYQMAANLPDWVSVDAKRVRQILLNLNNQTMRLTQNGKMRIEGAIAQTLAGAEEGSNTAMLSLVFSGYQAGLTQAFLDKLFASTFEAENPYAIRSSSAGMGLEIARNLAKTMGGDVLADCSPAGAFNFKFTLPIRLESAHGETAQTKSTAPSRIEPASRSLRLLIAEDSPVNQLYLQRVLEKMGHSIHFVDTGIAAVECLQNEEFDAVLLDYHMPIVNGVEATTMIRRLDSAKSQIKIIMVTADVLGQTREQALQAGVNEVLSKPVSAQQLHAALTVLAT